MKQYDANDILQEYVRRFGDTTSLEDTRELGHRTFKWRNDLFDYQLGFIDDESQIKTALCSRRSGKTYASCYYLLEEASRYPDIICAYIALTRRSAKRLMWTELKRADRKYMLNIKFNNAELVAELNNGSQIILAGADDEAEVDKLRGSAYRLVIIDEAASFGPHLSVLIEEVLEPALVDHNGTLAMIGTPAAHCSGIFYEATTGIRPEYSTHSWTIMENPHIPHAEEWLDRRRKQKRWTDDNPIYQREWRGKWVRSDDSLIYKYDRKNLVESMPTDEFDFEYCLGVDLGYEDATALVVGAFCRNLPDFYVVESFKKSHMLPVDIAAKVRELDSAYNFTTMVADTGGLGKSIVEEFRKRYSLPLKAAEKRNKGSYIELLNDDLATGKVKVLDQSILSEWDVLQWDEDRRKEDPRFENHLSDACLYAWRESRHYTFQEDESYIPEGFCEEEFKIMQRIEGKLYKPEKPWWESEWTLN